MKQVEISVAGIVGGGVCLSTSDGQKLNALISDHIRAGNKVVLSFSGITRMTTAFLNAAIGQLYGEFDTSLVKAHLGNPKHVEPWHIERIKRTTDRAKSYFAEGPRQGVMSAYTRQMGISVDDDF